MKTKVLASAALALALSAATASAATTYCFTSGGFSACASASIQVNGSTTVLTVDLQNLSGSTGNSYFALDAFGLYYLVPPSYTGSIALSSGPSGWSNGVPTSLLNPGPASGTPFWIGGAAAGPGINNALVGCAWNGSPNTHSTCASPITFTFALTAGANFSLANLNLALRGQEWYDPNGTFRGDSFKCYSTDPNCVVIPGNGTPTAIPEPATMILLASGLAGLGAAGLVRRRKQRQAS